jgi:tetratricopeptide (TPR) repeat protein
MIFTGPGRRGPHAWLGYLRGADRWELEAGRFAYDNYAIGYTRDPQTGRQLSDRELEYLCDRALRGAPYRNAARRVRLGTVLLALGEAELARSAAEAAIALVPVYDPAWAVAGETIDAAREPDAFLRLLERQAAAFRKYPDAVAAIRLRQAELLRRLDRGDEAARLLEQDRSRLGRGREDLAQALAVARVRQAYEAGDARGARTLLERLLRDQRREGAKTMPLLRGYVEFTRETGQAREALTFLRPYLRSLIRNHSRALGLQRECLELLAVAHKNAGDTAGADRVRRELER